MRDGYGVFETGDGQVYQGDWKRGKPHGSGSATYNDGSDYNGEWRDGKRHGTGTMTYANGDNYQGEWDQGIKCGTGRMIWYSRRAEYVGKWAAGVPHGNGVYTWKVRAVRDYQYPMDNVYTGTFFNGKREGYGVFQYSTGACYDGEWLANVKHGRANFITENGRQYSGTFHKDHTTVPFTKFDNGTMCLRQTCRMFFASHIAYLPERPWRQH